MYEKQFICCSTEHNPLFFCSLLCTEIEPTVIFSSSFTACFADNVEKRAATQGMILHVFSGQPKMWDCT